MTSLCNGRQATTTDTASCVSRAINNKKGMTLIELIVSMAIFAIFAMSLLLIVGPTLSNFARSKELSDAIALSTNIESVLANEISLAKAITVDPNGTSIVVEKYNGVKVRFESDVTSGILLKNGEPYFDVKFYNGNFMSLKFAYNDTADVYTIDLTLEGRQFADHQLYRTLDVRMIGT